MRVIVARGRQDAVRRRPGEATPLDGRRADEIGFRLDGRDAAATELTIGAGVAIGVVVTRRPMMVTGAESGIQAYFEGSVAAAGRLRQGDVVRDRRQGLNGQRQRK